MENEEMLEQTNETENVDTQTTEENVGGIELTDTTDSTAPVEEEKKEVKTLRQLLKENPDYQQEYTDMLTKRLNIENRKFERELSKYKSAEAVLQKGLGATDIIDAEQKLRDFYKAEGIDIPESSSTGLNNHEIKILAQAEANEIIESGDAEAEANRLASKGYDHMNSREKAVFETLAEHLTKEKKVNELKSMGVSSDLLESKDFKNFASQFNSKTGIKVIYDLYSKTHKETKKFEKIGSVKTDTKNDIVKDFYTYEEAMKFTKSDFDKNPELYKAVERSMSKW